jgi:hypothetical protein
LPIDANQDETRKQHLSSSVHRKRSTDINEWDQTFITVDQEMLFDIILAANYLDIKSLLSFFLYLIYCSHSSSSTVMLVARLLQI